MDWFHWHCINTQVPTAILHLGAGLGAELATYSSLYPCRIVLVEPQPVLASRLRRKTAAMKNVEVFQLAVAPDEGEASLSVFNLPDCGSLRQPTGLYSLFPGLEQTGTLRVDTTTLPALVDDLGWQNADDHWLVLDAPGAESCVIEALEVDGLSRYFTHIFLRAGAEPLFEGDYVLDKLYGQLSRLGYEPFGGAEEVDPDFPRHHFALNSAALEAAELRNQLAAMRSAMENERKEHQQAIERTRDQYGEELAALCSAAESERKEQQQALDEAKENFNRELAGFRVQVHGERGGEAQPRAFEQARDDFGQTMADLTANSEKTSADLAIALRLQELREADLKELRDRYGEVVTLRDQQHELLVELRQRLHGIAQYFDVSESTSGDRFVSPEPSRADPGCSVNGVDGEIEAGS